MANELASALSPYLRQHADNPVDWREWGPGAFTEASERDVPVLLSIGYAACHWCHVMAHESFEDAQVADVLNAAFVSVKVDREERPDVDAAYMAATTALTGHGGWPMTCLLTPAGEPFFAGTYLPKAAFLELLDQVSALWRERRGDVLASSAHITAQLRAYERTRPPVALGLAELDVAAAELAQGFDAVRGGFGGAPKFPPGMALHFLLRQHTRTGDPASLDMVARTCDAMARGGLYDQLGGGFARYSTDADWVVPHFEKMLYDNAILLRTYAAWSRRDPTPLARRVTVETAQFLLRDLLTEQGAFAAALDADTDGVEGLTYVWTPEQLREVLGDEAPATAALLGVTDAGTFEQGASTLQLRDDPADPGWWEGIRDRLLASRAERPQPARDDKVVTSWNGLAICRTGRRRPGARRRPVGGGGGEGSGIRPAGALGRRAPAAHLARWPRIGGPRTSRRLRQPDRGPDPALPGRQRQPMARTRARVGRRCHGALPRHSERRHGRLAGDAGRRRTPLPAARHRRRQRRTRRAVRTGRRPADTRRPDRTNCPAKPRERVDRSQWRTGAGQSPLRGLDAGRG